MTDTQELRRLISESGLKYKFIAEKLGLSTTGLQKKINNLVEFKPSEINVLCDILRITSLQQKNNLFFKVKVDK